MSRRLGKFISVEGDEFTGKTNVAMILAVALPEILGVPCLYYREPGGSDDAEDVRNALKAPLPQFLNDEERAIFEAKLFYWARELGMHDTVMPWRERHPNGVTIADRFDDSTHAYQGGAGGCPQNILDSLRAMVVGVNGPSRTYYFHIDGDTFQERWIADKQNGTRGDDAMTRLDDLGADYHASLRDRYEAMVGEEPERFTQINACETPRQVMTSVWTDLVHHLDRAGGILQMPVDEAVQKLGQVFALEQYQAYEQAALLVEP